jgi:hypothetical protein
MDAKHDDILFSETGCVLLVPKSHPCSVSAARARKEVKQYLSAPQATQRYRLAIAGFERELRDCLSEVIFNHDHPSGEMRG